MTNRRHDALMTLAFSLYANPGAYAVLVGAGVSAPALPTAWGVLTDLTERLALLSGVEPDDPIAWYEEKFGEEPRYESLLERLAPTQLERQRLLRGYFEPTAEDIENGSKQPTTAHRALAQLVKGGAVRVIVTLNFDRLIEQALRAEGIEPTVAATPEDIAGLAPLHTLNCCVIHLHGDYLNPTSMRNTADELSKYSPATDALLERVLSEYGLVVAGWSSVYDPVLRAAVATHYPSRYSLAWFEPNDMQEQGSELLGLKKGTHVRATADEAFGQLSDAVIALRTRGSRHPLALPVAVETAKRELSGRKVAIGLHDTLAREFTTLHALPDFHLPDHQSDASYGGYPAILDRVEEATLVPCGLVATLAYWGSDQTDQWWLNELSRFGALGRGSGLTRLLNLRPASGTLLFYAAGVAAVASGRFELVARMFQLQRNNIYRGEMDRLRDVLAADAQYDGSANRAGRTRATLYPVLVEATGLGPVVLEEAWQTFELLRLAAGTAAHPEFEKLCSDFVETAKTLQSANDAYEAANSAGAGTSAAQQTRHAAWEAHGRVMGKLSRLRPVGAPHILVRDTRMDESYQSELALQLADDLEQEGAAHPIARAGFHASPLAIALGLRTVSRAVGMVGSNLAWSRVEDRAGWIPSAVWVDTGETPDEL